MRPLHLTACLLGLSAIACGPERMGFNTDASMDGSTSMGGDASTSEAAVSDEGPDVVTSPDVRPIPVEGGMPIGDEVLVYAHSDTKLFSVDPRTNPPTFRTVGTFRFPSGTPSGTDMTDLAVDENMQLVGTSSTTVYRIYPMTAACTRLASLPTNAGLFVGLTFLPRGVLDPNAEVLVAATTEGVYYRIDTMTGRSMRLGQFQAGWTLSGDIVSIRGAETYVTVRQMNSGGMPNNDRLATLDPSTGRITIIGDTGFTQIFGLGYWRSTLYGFTRSGQFLRIDSTTGNASLINMPVDQSLTPPRPVGQFSGAGVTTLAPTAPG